MLTVQELKSSIQGVPELIEAISSLAGIPGAMLLLFIFFLWPVFNIGIKPVWGILESRKRQKIKDLNDYVGRSSLSTGSSLEVIRDIRESLYFEAATGIRAERHEREGLIRLHKEICHSTTWDEIRRARKYIVVERDERVTISPLDIGDRINYAYNFAVGWMMLFVGASLFVVSLYFETRGLAAVLSGAMAGVLLTLVGVYAFSQLWPIRLRSKIASELRNCASNSIPT